MQFRRFWITNIYLVRGRNHARGEPDLNATVRAGNVFDVLPAVMRARAYGYRDVGFEKVGEERLEDVRSAFP